MRSPREKDSLSIVIDLISSKNLTATESPNEFDQYDLEVKEKNCLIEVKERYLSKKKFLYYSMSGFILEEKKYNYLLGKKSRYCNVIKFEDFILCLFWNINKLEEVESFSLCTARTTDFEDKRLMSKPVKYLKPDMATSIFIKEINGEWERINKNKLYKKLK